MKIKLRLMSLMSCTAMAGLSAGNVVAQDYGFRLRSCIDLVHQGRDFEGARHHFRPAFGCSA